MIIKKKYGDCRLFEQFQLIRNHNQAFNLLRHQRGEMVCQELFNFLTAVKLKYPYGVRQSTLKRAIQLTDDSIFRTINFSVLKSCFSECDLSELPGTSEQYVNGGMWVRGDIQPYDEKKYKGLDRLHGWEKEQWMVPRFKDCETEDGLKHYMEEVFTRSKFDQESANHRHELAFCIDLYFRQIVAELAHLQKIYHCRYNQDHVEENVYSLRPVFKLMLQAKCLIFQKR